VSTTGNFERVAVIGSGVSGLVTAHLLRPHADVTVFEADSKVGGHVNTVEVVDGDRTFAIDTGFIVYNERNYPRFTALLDDLGVETQPSDMSFSVSSPSTGLEYAGTNFNTLLARRTNALRPSFVRMLVDVTRFNRAARELLSRDDLSLTIAQFLDEGRYSPSFVDDYLVPLGASIWSANPLTFTEFPAAPLARFLDQHGLLSLGDRPRWRTVTGGARRYVDALVRPLGERVRTNCPVRSVVRDESGVFVHSGAHLEGERFDRVVFATHADTALALLERPTDDETSILGAMRFQFNRATLHTDASLLPRRPRAHASWNYLQSGEDSSMPVLTYYANRLQGLVSTTDYCITLNADDAIDPSRVLASFDYTHPVFDEAALRAQRRHHEIDGHHHTHFVGAYWGYGFHEDGAQSAHRVASRILGARAAEVAPAP
jgi:predicted NAD/FAD-binding protein